MKTRRLTALILVIAMLLSFAACGTTETNASAEGEQITLQNNVVVDNATQETTSKESEETASEATDETSVPEVESSETSVSETSGEVSEESKQEEPSQGDEPNLDIGNVLVSNGPEETEEKVETVEVTNTNTVVPDGEYNKGIVLVKVKESFNETDLGTLSYTSAEPLYKGSKWYNVTLSDSSKTEDAVTYLTNLGTFEKVDYDYVMGTTDKEFENPNYDKQTNLGLSNIPYGWTQNGKAPGGSPDVVVAVIDTGVDYTHLDLRNNIWINTAEIANNGKDDDGNGYVDDVYGWDCVGNDKDPMDDNGHGTHVAGIIAAENNKEGGIGVAYNCKVMVLKAGNSSGYFNNSDIAEAIQYAYMNGASVINMSFGGSQISVAVEEALENAYNSCILVAAAGNDGACNNLACKVCENVGVMYPAALPYVIGVMSTNANGTAVSGFSNYDHYPYGSIEYEVYAVGEGVGSTWPSNKYTCLNGTSMAAPTVSGIAALLRSSFSDREVYSTKFIQSQIVNTGTVNPYNYILEKTDSAHSVADVQEALTKLPKPEVNLYDYRIDDSTSISNKNNGNGVVDAGETVRLYIELHNRGGVATDVNVSIDTYRSTVGDETLTDPYFTFVNNTIQLSDIGTYSVRESGDKYFEIVVSPDCPNDYLADFNIRFTYENGLDEKDTTNYSGDGVARFNVSRGYHLPSTITEDTVYKADKLYIVGEDVIIPEGVTVTFEEGCEIQFYDDREYYNSPVITVYGTLNIAGTKDNMVTIAPNERNATFVCKIDVEKGGAAFIDYADCTNLRVYDRNYRAGNYTALTNSGISNSHMKSQTDSSGYSYEYSNASAKIDSNIISVAYIKNSYINENAAHLYAGEFDSNYIVMEGRSVELCPEANCYSPVGTSYYVGEGKFTNNIVYTSVNKFNPTSSYRRTLYIRCCNEVSNNIFLSSDNANPKTFLKIEEHKVGYTAFENNAFAEYFYTYASQIISNYLDSSGIPTIDIYSSCSNLSSLYPHVVSVEMFDKDGNPITTVGKEEIKVRVTFNRPMDKDAGTFLTFGTIEPYADYRIDGEYVSDTVWEGSYTLKAQIENGQNFLKVNNACAAEDQTKTVFGEYQLHEFTIDTTAAMAMNLQAVALDEGIELTFAQDDYDTLLGYNIYRSTDKDGNFVKLNPTILLPEENTFLDDNAEPGKTYWYTYTVVLSDFTESAPAGKVQATAKDTMAPSLYHTPVNQGYENNNLVISCTASDNVSIDKVTLYYRTVGETEWKSLVMSKQNDKYNATIFGSDVTLAGIEYYIVATDGISTVQKGSAEAPYTIVVKSADSLLGKGDVDGNGTVTTKDALMLMQCLNGDLLLTDDAFKRADLNGNTLLSSAEALRILQYVNGKVPNLDM